MRDPCRVRSATILPLVIDTWIYTGDKIVQNLNTSKTEEIWVSLVDMSVPISWLQYCTKVLENVNTEKTGNVQANSIISQICMWVYNYVNKNFNLKKAHLQIWFLIFPRNINLHDSQVQKLARLRTLSTNPRCALQEPCNLGKVS